MGLAKVAFETSIFDGVCVPSVIFLPDYWLYVLRPLGSGFCVWFVDDPIPFVSYLSNMENHLSILQGVSRKSDLPRMCVGALWVLKMQG